MRAPWGDPSRRRRRKDPLSHSGARPVAARQTSIFGYDASPRNPSTTTTSHDRRPYSPSKKTDRGGLSRAPAAPVLGSEAEDPHRPRCTALRRPATSTAGFAPAALWRCESLPSTSVSYSWSVCLSEPTFRPSFTSASMSCTATVVLPDSCAPVTRRTAGEDFFEWIEEAGLALLERIAPSSFGERRDPGIEGLPCRDQPPVRRGARQEVDRGDVVAVLVLLGPPAEAVGVEVEERLEEAQVRLVRAESRRVRHVHLDAAARLPRVLLERGPEDVRAEDDARHPEGVRRARRPRPRRATARRGARTAASCRAPRRGSCPRRGSRPDRRARSRASACSATGGPTRASRRSPRRVGARPPFRIGTTVRSQPKPCVAFAQRAISPGVIPCRTGTGYRPTKERSFSSGRFPSTTSPPSGFGRSRTTTGIFRFAHSLMTSAIVQTNV